MQYATVCLESSTDPYVKLINDDTVRLSMISMQKRVVDSYLNRISSRLTHLATHRELCLSM